MQQGIRTYLSILFLLLLSFPIVEKSVHGLEHADEKVCTITDKHFHTQEHTCSICDFTINDSNGIPESKIQFVNRSSEFQFNILAESKFVSHTFSDLPSRAPPIV